MIRDMLLMLSTRQPPDPTVEVNWHAAFCETTQGATSMATTRVLTGLTPGRSLVAFYGNRLLGHRLLGVGTFDGYVRLGTPRGDTLLRESELYTPGNHPPRLKGVIELRGVVPAAPNTSIESLGGIVEASQLRLTVENLPRGPARLLVYFSRIAA